jgi:hypothetical protein
MAKTEKRTLAELAEEMGRVIDAWKQERGLEPGSAKHALYFQLLTDLLRASKKCER